MKQNYQKQLDKLLDSLVEGQTTLPGGNSSLQTAATPAARPRLLLHACCGPCSSYVLEYLVRYFDITVYYYNPNIYPATEYERRLQELKDLYKRFPPALEGHVQVVEASYDPEDFYVAVGTRQEPALATEPEKGERCRRCYEFRLRRACEYASAHGFDYFCTTLSISPFKDAEKINVIGMALAGELVPRAGDAGDKAGGLTPRWLPSDFKKNNGFKRSLEISQEYNLYRQQYCGCIYSMKSMVK